MPTINCTEFHKRLADAIERRESVDNVILREHAGVCAECRASWLDALLLDSAVAQWKKPVSSQGLTERILTQVASNPSIEPATSPADRLPSRPRRFVRPAGAAVAALAVCACAMFLLTRSPQAPVRQGPDVVRDTPRTEPLRAPEVPRPIAMAQDAKPAQNTPPAGNARVEVLLADAGTAYLHLAGHAAQAVTAASVLVPSTDETEKAATTPKEETRWVDDVRHEIAPVTHQLSHAFEFLIDAVPTKQVPAT
jgi:hypothetical protein